MFAERLHLWALFSEAIDGLRVVWSGHRMTWVKNMKSLTSGLARVS